MTEADATRCRTARMIQRVKTGDMQTTASVNDQWLAELEDVDMLRVVDRPGRSVTLAL